MNAQMDCESKKRKKKKKGNSCWSKGRLKHFSTIVEQIHVKKKKKVDDKLWQALRRKKSVSPNDWLPPQMRKCAGREMKTSFEGRL